MADPDPDPGNSVLDASDERFGALYENTTDAIAEVRLVDDVFVVLDVNPAFEEVFGYGAEEIVGEDIDEYVLAEGEGEAFDSLGGAMKRGETVRREVRRRTADGIKDFRARAVPLEVGGGWTQGFVIYTDISEQKEKQRRLERFAGIVGHDLRNPLQIAQGNLVATIEAADDPPDTLEGALDAVEEIEGIVERLLTLTRTDGDGLEGAPVDLGPIARRAWDLVAAPDGSLAVEGCRVRADEGALKQLLSNLFQNAVDHGGAGVTVRVGPLGDDAGFYVADDGSGIPKDERQRVFEEGYTEAEEGLGLGLKIVEQIADAHGWSVSVTESNQGGVRFEFRDVEHPE